MISYAGTTRQIAFYIGSMELSGGATDPNMLLTYVMSSESFTSIAASVTATHQI
jgi:hypothetical protein